jgi:hypothetical protein
MLRDFIDVDSVYKSALSSPQTLTALVKMDVEYFNLFTDNGCYRQLI